MAVQECNINPEFKNELFFDIERTGETLKENLEEQSKELKEFLEVSKKKIDSQVNCAKFQAAYGFTVSKKERLKTMKEVKEVRAELWREALKKAKGNTKNAYAFYKEACSFP